MRLSVFINIVEISQTDHRRLFRYNIAQFPDYYANSNSWRWIVRSANDCSCYLTWILFLLLIDGSKYTRIKAALPQYAFKKNNTLRQRNSS